MQGNAKAFSLGAWLSAEWSKGRNGSCVRFDI